MGGTWTSATFTADLISLRRQGVVGALVPNSVVVSNGNQGNSPLQNNGLLEWVAERAFTVNTGAGTNFVNSNGLSAMSSAGTAPIAVGVDWC